MNFTVEEYEQRLEKTRSAMRQSGIDLLITVDPSNMHWLTGYDGWSFYVPQAVIISLDEPPRWWGRPMDKAGAARTTRLSFDQMFSYSDDHVQNPQKHACLNLAMLVENWGFAKASLGVEMDNYYFTAAAMAALAKGLPKANFIDATGLVNRQRAVKSSTELDYMRRAGKIVELMHQRIRDNIQPGMRKCDLVADIYDAAIRGTPQYGGDYPAIVPMLPSGPDAAAAHLTWDDQPLRSDEGTFFEIAGVYKRYHCPLSRTAFIGQPPQKFTDAHKAVLEGLEAGLEQVKPGNTCEDIANAFFQVLKKHGIDKDSRTGYPIGLSYPPDWGERTMSLRTGDKTVLETGMTFHFMPGIWMEDWGLEVTESFVVTENGPQLLSNVSRDLVIIA